MFKIPEWGDDVPKLNLKFARSTNKKTKSNTKTPQKQQQPSDAGKKAINHKKNNVGGVSKQKNKFNQKYNNVNNIEITLSDKQNYNHNKYESTGNRNNFVKRNSNIRENNNVSSFNSKNKNGSKKKSTKSGNKNPQKPNLNKKLANSKRTLLDDPSDIQNLNTDKPDEEIIRVKKKKLEDAIKNEDREEILFKEGKRKKKKKKVVSGIVINNKKERLKKLLQTQSNRTLIIVKGNALRTRMMEKLKAAQFRYINEKLYTSSGSDAQQLFQTDPAAFHTYHQGYQQQVKKWPVSPLDVIINKLKKIPKTHIIADMGCGEAMLSRRVPHQVHSFDLVSLAPSVQVCDMAHTPLLACSVDVVVYCLALMGTDLTQYLVEANRVLKDGGLLLIAEVESRFEDVEAFIKDVERLGFKLKKLDKSHQVFYFMELTKVRDPPVKKSKLPTLTLKPCLYKRR